MFVLFACSGTDNGPYSLFWRGRGSLFILELTDLISAAGACLILWGPERRFWWGGRTPRGIFLENHQAKFLSCRLATSPSSLFLFPLPRSVSPFPCYDFSVCLPSWTRLFSLGTTCKLHHPSYLRLIFEVKTRISTAFKVTLLKISVILANLLTSHFLVLRSGNWVDLVL